MPTDTRELDTKKQGHQAEMANELTRQNTELNDFMMGLLRALRRKKGFGLFFVQCNPAQGRQVIRSIRKRFSGEKVEEVKLSRSSETLYEELLERYNAKKYKIVCISGVEQALYDYEDTKRLSGWSSEELYSYSWKGVPPLLSHLNRQREAFQSSLPVSLVFLVPGFVIDYFVQRAPDFFDWRSGFFKFPESTEELQKISQKLIDETSEEYLSMTSKQKMERILEIKDQVSLLSKTDSIQVSHLLREQGKLFSSEGEHNKAIDCYTRSLSSFPGNREALNSKGMVLIALERYEEALENYEQAIELDPDYSIAWSVRGIVLSVLERYNEALESHDKALHLEQKSHLSWSIRGEVLINLGRYEDALESYDKAIELKPDDYLAWSDRGKVLSKLKRYEDALESYDKAIELEPNAYSLWSDRGVVFNSLGKYEDALRNHVRALELKPDYIFGLGVQGLSLVNLGRYEEALKSYDKAIELGFDHHVAWENRGDVLSILSRYEDALESYDRALELNSNDYVAWSNRGDVLVNLRKCKEALESYNRSIEIEPNYQPAWSGRGSVLSDLCRYEESIKSCQIAIELVPDSHSAHVTQGLSYYQLGKFEDSCNAFKEANRIQPDDEQSWNNQAYLLLARASYGDTCVIEKPLIIRDRRLYDIARNYSPASEQECYKSLSLLKQALSIEPEFVFAIVNKSFPEYYLDRYTSSLESCENALRLDACNLEQVNEIIYSNMGYSLLALHRTQEALQAFVNALDIDPTLSEAWMGKGTVLCELNRYAEAIESFTKAEHLNHPLAPVELRRVGEYLSSAA